MAFLRILALSLVVLWASKTFALTQSVDEKNLVKNVDDIASFRWQGIQWNIPNKLLLYFPISLTKNNEIDIDAGYIHSDQRLVPFYQPHDLAVSIRIVTDDSEDPKREFNAIRRTGPSLTSNPALQSLKLDGLTYLGTQSNLNFFQLADQGAYVVCNLNWVDALHSLKLGSDVGDKMFYCTTAFALPSGLFLWMRLPSIRLNDMATVFGASDKEILSYMH